MADVSRAGIPSSSSKHIYDGVFSSSKAKSTVFTSFNDDDYGEIFGCSKLDSGGWESSCGSIPVVELPVSEQRVRGVRGIEMDYGGVLGGFSDEGLSLMNGDELFDQLKKKPRTSPPTLVSVSRPRSKEQKKEVTKSHMPSHYQNVQPSNDDISKSSDGVQQYKQKANDMPSTETNDTGHERALLQEVQNSRTPVVKPDSQFDHVMPTRDPHPENSSSDLKGNKPKTGHDVDFQKSPVFSELNSAATSHETHHFTNQMNRVSREVDSSHAAVVSETPVIQADTEVEVTKGKHSRHSSLNIGVNEHKTEFDASFQKAHGLNGSNSAATMEDEADADHDVKNDIGVDGLSNVGPTKQNSEVRAHSVSYQESGSSSSSVAGFDSGKNLRRHSRMMSLDLGRQASDHDAGGSHRKSRLGSSYSFDASHDPSVARIKVQPSKVVPLPSQPHIFPMESHYKISENSKSGSPLPSLDDQLDMNSSAAILASALQKAVEEAEMQIRLAKEFLERDSRGCTKLRFKDTLKTKVMKENKHVNKVNHVKKKKNVVEDCSLVDDATVSSSFGRESVSEAARFVPVEDRKQSVTREKIEAQEFTAEGGKNEAGEWEAKKQLNQLISGVKNRLASFMTWQVETEKKEESKEVESIKQPHSTEYSGCEPKETVENQSVIEESVMRVAPQHIESEEKVGDVVDSTLDTVGPTSTNFLFFSFNSRKWKGLSQTEVTDEKENHGNSKIEVENKQEHEVNVEVHGSVSQDYGEKLINSMYEECIAAIAEHYPMAEHDTNRFIHEEDDDSQLCGDDCAVGVGHRDEHGVDQIELKGEEKANDRTESILEVVDEVNEERCSDTDASIHEADDGKRLNEECGNDSDDASFHEVDDEASVNEEYASTHEEGYDRTVSSDEAGNRKLTEEHGDGNDQDEIEVFEESDDHPDNAQLLEKVGSKSEERFESPLTERDQCEMYDIEEVSAQMNEKNEGGYHSKADNAEETMKDVEQAEEVVGRIVGGDVEAETEFSVENGEIIEKNDFPSDVETVVETLVSHDEETDEKMEITNHSAEPHVVPDHLVLSHTAIECIENSVKFDAIEQLDSIDPESENHPVLPECEMNVNCGPRDVADGEETESGVELDGIECHDSINEAFSCENSVPNECGTDVDHGQETELKPEDILVNQTEHLHEFGMTSDASVGPTVSDQEAEKLNVEGIHRRRRWFENGETIGAVERPLILEEADRVDHDTSEATREADSVETTHKRRRWFAEKGEEGSPGSTSLFEGIKVTSQLDHEIVKPDECVGESNTEGGEVVTEVKDKPNVEATPRRKRWFETVEDVGSTKIVSHEDDRKQEVPDKVEPVNEPQRDTDEERWFESVEDVGPTKTVSHEDDRKQEVPDKVEPVNEPQRDMDEERWSGSVEDVGPTKAASHEDNRKQEIPNRVEPVNGPHRDMDEESKRKKERIAVERAIREVRERAFAEAKERAKREATERPPSRLTGQKSGLSGQAGPSDKAWMEERIKARAAVDRAIAEVRERALQKALSEKAAQRSREETGRYPPERSSSLDPKYGSSSNSRSSYPSNNDVNLDGANGESEQRRKARLERQNRTMERAAKALEEKNKRDLLVQKEQIARNILAEALDAEVKRWSTGKEGNVRALLSTLQYILGADSGWQAVSLTDLVAPTAVRKAYKKATLCVHPDKLQQRGASIQQKYICEKVFDLLKDAWSRFNPEER